MRVHLITPENFQWLNGYRDAVSERATCVISEKPYFSGSEVMVFLWCNEDTVRFVNGNPKLCKYIVFVRRYEIFAGLVNMINWDKVDAVILVNDELAEIFRQKTGKDCEVIYNGVDPAKWQFKVRGHGEKIAVVGWINQKKNLPLAIQILARCPGKSMHFAGGVQCEATSLYLKDMAKDLSLNVEFCGRQSNMDLWLEDKSYILSCAISEGCPNNVIEGMAKGIKPIVHSWPGAKQQFNEYVFQTIDEAVTLIMRDQYESEKYLACVVEKFGTDSYKKLAGIAWGLING